MSKRKTSRSRAKPIGAMSQQERLKNYQKDMDELSKKWGFGMQVKVGNITTGEMSDGKINISLDKGVVIVPIAEWVAPKIPSWYKPSKDEEPDDKNDDMGEDSPSP